MSSLIPLLNKEKERKPSTKCPGEGWEWRGKGKPGSKEGSWYNPQTDERLRPDLEHNDPVGPHWDYETGRGKDHREGRLYPDETYEEK
jgi:hypothetical protein